MAPIHPVHSILSLLILGACLVGASVISSDSGALSAFAPSLAPGLRLPRKCVTGAQSPTFLSPMRRRQAASGIVRSSGNLRMGLNEELWKAAEYGFEKDVEDLVGKGADVHSADESQMGKTALHFAAGQGHAMAVAKLLDLGADPDVKTEIGSGPLHLAAAYGHFTAINYLLQYGANPVMENIDGDTPLKIAKFKGRYSDRVDFVHVVSVLEEAASKPRR